MNERHHKLYNYEVTPPAACWDKVASELDASDIAYQYPARMRAYGVEPPVSTWENIKNAISGNNKSGAKSITPLIRYAVAAAILGFIAWGGIRLMDRNKNTGTDLASSTEPGVPITKKEAPIVTGSGHQTDNNLPEPTSIDEDPVAEARDNAALEASKKTYASANIPNRSKLRNVSDFFFAPDFSASSNTRSIDFGEPEDDMNEDEPSGERYFTLITPDGNIIRMSKKWGDLVCCVSGEEQDQDCVEQMKKWRQQLASPSRGHATGSFMDILGLLKSLQDDEL